MDRFPNPFGKRVVPVIQPSTRTYLKNHWEPRGLRWWGLVRISIYNEYTRQTSESTRALYINRYRAMKAHGIGLFVWDHYIEFEHRCFIYIAQYRSMRALGVSLSTRDQQFCDCRFIAGMCEYQEWYQMYFRCSPLQWGLRLANNLTLLE